MIVRLAALLTLASALTGAPAVVGAADRADTAGSEVARRGTVLTAPEAAARAAAGTLALVDVRAPREWRETGIAKGAHPVSIHNPDGIKAFVADLARAVNGDRAAPIALICASGVRSLRAQRILLANGFTNIKNVPEGMLGRPGAGPGWLKRGLPVSPCPEC